MWYMNLDSNNKPNGWSNEPSIGYIEVLQVVRDTHEINPDFIWNGVGLVAPPTPTPETLLSKQARVWLSIKAKREAHRVGGVFVAGKWFHTDDSSRIQHLGLTIMGAGIPANISWKTMDGTFMVMTQVLAGQLFQAVTVMDQIDFTTAENHRIAMEALPDPLVYSFSTGWVASYGG